MKTRRLSVISSCLWVGLVAAALAGPTLAQTPGLDAQCHGPNATHEQRVAACSAVIAAGTAGKRDLADAYAQRGFAYTRSRKLDLAKQDLDQAIKTDPGYARGYINRANFWNVARRPDLALGDAEAAVCLAPFAALSFFVHGSASLKLGRYDQAIADYGKALGLNASLGVDIYELRGLAYHRKGDEDHAIADYSALLKLRPNNVGALLDRGDALRNKKDYAKAAVDYGEAIKLAPDNPGGWKGRGFIRVVTHDPKEAAADFDQAIKLSPNESGLYLDRGIALDFLGERTKALADYDMAIKLEPNHPLAYVNRAEPLNSIGEHAEAIASIRKALELTPGFGPALEELAKIGNEDEKAQAKQSALQGENLRKAYFLCTFPVSNTNFTVKHVNDVIAACTALINTPGGNAKDRSLVHLQRGAMYRRLGKFELALADFTESIHYDPRSAYADTGRGNAERGLHQVDAAIADHSKAIALKPDYVEAYNNRGNAWRDKSDNERAIADYDAAIRIDPHYASAYFNRGNARLDLGDKKGAIADYRAALKVNPRFAQAAEMLHRVAGEEPQRKRRRRH